MIAVSAHVQGVLRPSFDCAKCGQPWPCAPAKVELAELFRGDPIGLFSFLGHELVEAIDSAAQGRAVGGIGILYDRFLGWIPKAAEAP